MKKLAKVLAIILALATVLTVFAACSETAQQSSKEDVSQSTNESKADDSGDESQSEATSTEWEYEEDTSPFEFTVWFPSIWGWGKGALDNGWDDSPVFQHITEKTGGKINFDIPVGTEDDLAGTMIAAGTYPDACVFGSYNSPYIAQMRDAGLIYSWTELIDEYAPKMWDLIPDSMLTGHSDADGILWYYTGFAYHETWAEDATALGCTSVGGGAHGTNIIFCRQDILDAFGKDDITDLDTFTEYLYYCKENYPDIDAIQLFDNDPRGTIFTHFKSTFGCHLSNTYPQEDGTLKFFMYDPAYVDYLTWLNQLYRDGVISSNQLTDDQTALDTKLYSGSYGAIMSATYTAYNTLEQTLKENYGEDTDKLYIAVGPIQKEGIEWKAMFLRSSGGQTTVITKNTKIPDRIIKFFEYLFTEDGQMTINSGIEGVDWEWNDDGSVSHTQEMTDLCSSDLEAWGAKYKLGALWAPWVNTSYWEGLLGAMLTPAGRAADENAKRLGPDFVTDIWAEGYADIESCIEGGSDLDVIRTKINDACKIAGMKMITAKDEAEFNSIYEQCLKDIEALGVAQIEEAYTAEHKAQCEALGINP